MATDKIGFIKGVLSLQFFEKGALIREEKANNLIVTGGYNALLSALKGDADKYIHKVQMGTRGTAPVAGDTAITGAIDITIISKTVVGSKLVITFEIGSSLGNGTTISEFGLICNDGTLFSRKAWAPFTKISDLTINGTWEINL